MNEGDPSAAASTTAAAGRAGEEMAFSAVAVGQANRWRRGRLAVASVAA